MNRPADPLLEEAASLAWPERNQRWLSQRLAFWRERIEQRAAGATLTGNEGAPPPGDEFDPAAWQLRALFGLTAFEAELLLLAAGIEIDTPLRDAVARAQGLSPHEPVRLRFALALALLPEAHWDALSPARPLRHWALLHADTECGLSQALLRADERVVHYLTGVAACDERLLGICQHDPAPSESARDQLAETIAAALAPLRDPLVLLPNAAEDAGCKRHARTLACAAFAQLGMRTLWLDGAAIASFAHGELRDLIALARRVDREAALTHAGVALALEADTAQNGLAVRLLTELRSPLIVLGALSPLQLADLPTRRVLRFNVSRPVAAPHDAVPLPLRRAAQRALQQFHVEPALLEQALNAASAITDEIAAEQAMWSLLRESARGGLDALAQRIESRATFDDLVLPPFVATQLREIRCQLLHRQRVYDDWGFGERHRRGIGIAALFTGESGTGKTLAAEAIANEARLDLYRVDLANVVSKYIGETEKNLAKLFDAAEHSGAVLLFDEADALFGKRSEVKDSHDRYANIEVAYLLQRIDCYRGLAVLTSNLKSALDRAFLRRIRFVVQFPFPDAAARAEIWRRSFPSQAPLSTLDWMALAKLQLAGGNIRGIAVNAAFRAAERGGAIEQADVMSSARAEFSKLERVFNGADGATRQAAS